MLTHSSAPILYPLSLGPAVLADIKRGLPSVLLFELEAGAGYRQTTHITLLRGQLLAADAQEREDDPEWSAATQAASATSAAAPEAPLVLPWLWCSHYRCNHADADGSGSSGPKLAENQMWRAGPQGALLLACLPEAGLGLGGVLGAEPATKLSKGCCCRCCSPAHCPL